jgi:hypothetical protein
MASNKFLFRLVSFADFLKPFLSPRVTYGDSSNYVGGCSCKSFLFMIISSVSFGLMLHALERHFLTALFLLLQNFSTCLSFDKGYSLS